MIKVYDRPISHGFGPARVRTDDLVPVSTPILDAGVAAMLDTIRAPSQEAAEIAKSIQSMTLGRRIR